MVHRYSWDKDAEEGNPVNKNNKNINQDSSSYFKRLYSYALAFLFGGLASYGLVSIAYNEQIRNLRYFRNSYITRITDLNAELSVHEDYKLNSKSRIDSLSNVISSRDSLVAILAHENIIFKTSAETAWDKVRFEHMFHMGKLSTYTDIYNDLVEKGVIK